MIMASEDLVLLCGEYVELRGVRLAPDVLALNGVASGVVDHAHGDLAHATAFRFLFSVQKMMGIKPPGLSGVPTSVKTEKSRPPST